jgi:hypothetical protein
MLVRQERFLMDMNSRTWNAINSARQFRQQFEENVFASEIREALEKKAFDVEISPTVQPRQFQPVVLEVLFEQSTLNDSSAKKEISCLWEFSKNVGNESGWRISHYFRNRNEANLILTFKDRNGVVITTMGSQGDPYKVDIRDRQKETKDGRITLEIIKFLIAFVVAVLALFSGAKEQILKLDIIAGLIAVLGIGFGADTIKNLITKQPQEEN